MKYLNLQILRAFAAFSVVLHHVTDMLENYIANIDTGIYFFHGGVDIFFVISGFVMCAAVESRPQSPRAFLAARLARIVPIYWLLTGVAALALLAGLHLFGWPGFSWHQLIGSLLFFPTFQDGHFLKPILFVGWTLNFEMLFYVLFAISLFAKSIQVQRLLVVAMLIGLVLANQIIGGELLSIWGHAMVLEFLGGMAVWTLLKKWTPTRVQSASAIVAGAIAFPGAQLFFTVETLSANPQMFFGVPAALLVLGAAGLEQHGLFLKNKPMLLLGDASYSLYLVHIFVFAAVGKASVVIGLNQSFSGLVITIAAAVGGSLVASLLFHLFVERPLNQSTRSLLSRRPARTMAVPSGA
ncbi:MAG: acyltransferase [Pseudomonadota bacterium]|nr:acyltransferase [Pseudomonadota bacterium]